MPTRQDPFRLDGKTARVSGGARGIGAAIAEALAASGERLPDLCLDADDLHGADV